MHSSPEAPDRDGNKQHVPHKGGLANQNVTRPAPIDVDSSSKTEKEKTGSESERAPDSDVTARRKP